MTPGRKRIVMRVKRGKVCCLLSTAGGERFSAYHFILCSAIHWWPMPMAGAHGVNSSMILLLLHPHSKSGYYEDQEIKRIRREAQDGCSGTEVGHGMLESHMTVEKKV